MGSGYGFLMIKGDMGMYAGMGRNTLPETVFFSSSSVFWHSGGSRTLTRARMESCESQKGLELTDPPSRTHAPIPDTRWV